jgi:hypothetical protein
MPQCEGARVPPSARRDLDAHLIESGAPSRLSGIRDGLLTAYLVIAIAIGFTTVLVSLVLLFALK